VGLISGTSMDGIDAALVRISGPVTRPSVRPMAFEAVPYPGWLRERLLAIAGGDSTTAEEIDRLHNVLGLAFGEAAVKVCRRGRVKPGELFVVGSHGQTIHHFGGVTQGSADLLSKVRGFWTGPAGQTAHLKRGSALLPCTLQIAEPAWIAELAGAPVVADFRTADIAAGGQGAPLVPMVDYLLLRDARQGTVALNIGGIANFTVIPAGAKPGEIFGFDTGPGNMIIDGLVRHFTNGQKAYDAGGHWAAKGQLIEPLLERMLRLPFFAQQPPKSAGREQFGEQFTRQFFLGADARADGVRPGLKALGPNQARRAPRPEDLLRTATELTARTIADALERFVLGKSDMHRLIVSGGGAHNRLLMMRLAKLLPGLRVHRSDELGLDVDAKEAIAFAVLADRTMHGLPGNLPGVTGARRPVVLGKISRP
jgi:anhydro-N-acetylmuramic acid kinase